MKRIKGILAFIAAVALVFTLSACQGSKAPESYELTAAGITLTALNQITGSGTYAGITQSASSGKTDSIEVSYTGISDGASAMQSYASYLTTQGFLEYYGVDGVQMCLARRDGDGASIVTARMDGDKLILRLEWKPTLQLSFGETQYVSGSSLAILPSSELVVFTYPVLGDAVSAQDTVNQQILDGVNDMIQYAKDIASGSEFKLMGNYTMDSTLVSDLRITLTGVLTIGESESNLSMEIAISDILNTPAAQYGSISVQ